MEVLTELKLTQQSNTPDLGHSDTAICGRLTMCRDVDHVRLRFVNATWESSATFTVLLMVLRMFTTFYTCVR
jgi:hypothetical protein